jgi:hypothetical protein
MTQAVFPEVQAATAALEQRITLTESEIAQMKEGISEKKKFLKGLKRAIAAVNPSSKKKAVAHQA